MTTSLSQLKDIQQNIDSQIKQAQSHLHDLNAKAIFLSGRICQQEEINTTVEEESQEDEANTDE